MARPPKLAGKVPTIRADWQWNGVDWVTTDAVLTGAWHQPSAERLALLFVNVSPEPVTARVVFDARPYGFPGPTLHATTISSEGSGAGFTAPWMLDREATFPPRSAWAWEITP
jgi:hypothetical protein